MLENIQFPNTVQCSKEELEKILQGKYGQEVTEKSGPNFGPRIIRVLSHLSSEGTKIYGESAEDTIQNIDKAVLELDVDENIKQWWSSFKEKINLILSGESLPLDEADTKQRLFSLDFEAIPPKHISLTDPEVTAFLQEYLVAHPESRTLFLEKIKNDNTLQDTIDFVLPLPDQNPYLECFCTELIERIPAKHSQPENNYWLIHSGDKELPNDPLAQADFEEHIQQAREHVTTAPWLSLTLLKKLQYGSLPLAQWNNNHPGELHPDIADIFRTFYDHIEDYIQKSIHTINESEECRGPILFLYRKDTPKTIYHLIKSRNKEGFVPLQKTTFDLLIHAHKKLNEYFVKYAPVSFFYENDDPFDNKTTYSAIDMSGGTREEKEKHTMRNTRCAEEYSHIGIPNAPDSVTKKVLSILFPLVFSYRKDREDYSASHNLPSDTKTLREIFDIVIEHWDLKSPLDTRIMKELLERLKQKYSPEEWDAFITEMRDKVQDVEAFMMDDEKLLMYSE